MSDATAKPEKQIVFKIEEGMDPQNVLCTTYQMRNFFNQLRDGYFTDLDVMNYIQHFKAALLAKPGATVLDVCCGRALMLPLLRYHAKEIKKYIGVDISQKNMDEAKRRSGSKEIPNQDYQAYYPFGVEFINSNVAEMANHIPHGSVDFIIYTSAIEHMHKDDGYQSLLECYKLLADDGMMLLSCPNTPGNGYDTQYAAHVYEWGYDELKVAMDEVGFRVDDEVGLVSSLKDLDILYGKLGPDMARYYQRMKAYLPKEFLKAFMAVPFPKEAKEVLFVVSKRDGKPKAKQTSLF